MIQGRHRRVAPRLGARCGGGLLTVAVLLAVGSVSRVVSADELDDLFSDEIDSTRPAEGDSPPAEDSSSGAVEGPEQRASESTAGSRISEPPAEAEPEPAPSPATVARPEPPSSEPPGRRPRQAIEEVIVTAQRRAENVRDVPIAVSVLQGSDLRDAAISSFDDMARYIPNVSFNTDFNSLYLRGIGTAELNVIGEQAVVYMLDDVYVSRLDYLKPGLMDLKQIEILKGPQGTLYGRNATGGVLKIDYGDPTDEWESYVNLSAGQQQLRSGEAALSGPLLDDLAFRVAGRWLEQDGHTRNLVDGDTVGDKDVKQARLKLRYDVTPSFDVTAGIHRFDYFVGGWAGTETFAYPEDSRAAIESLDPTFETELDRRGSSNSPARSDGAGWLVPLKANLELWGHAFTSISSFAGIDDFQGGDLDGNGAPLALLLVELDTDQWSQEVRVASPPGWLEYVGGAFFYTSSLSAKLNMPLVPDPGLRSLGGAEAVGPLATIFEPYLDPATDPATVFLGTDEQIDDIQGDFRIATESLGVFGQLKWNAFDFLSFLVGGRFSRDDRKGFGSVDPKGPAPIWESVALGGWSGKKRLVDTDFSPKLSILWEVSDAVTAYATYAQGFRGGSFNIASFEESDFLFDAEASETYETGIKTDLLGGLVRFNLGGFLTKYDDYQLAAFNGFGYIISNAEKAESRGIESDVTALLLPGLPVSGSLGFNDAEFVTHTQATCPTRPSSEEGGFPPQGTGALPPKQVCDLSGEPLFRAPRWTGNLRLGYELPVYRLPILDRPIHAFLGADATYKGAEFMDSDLDPLDRQGGYWLFNAQLGLRTADERWRLQLHGKNLSDELVKVFSGDIPLQAGAHWAHTNAPRTLFASLSFHY